MKQISLVSFAQLFLLELKIGGTPGDDRAGRRVTGSHHT